LKNKLFSSLIIMMVVIFSMGGGVVAWFTDETTAETQNFMVGYLKVSAPKLLYETGQWKAGQTVELTYQIKNLGDQDVFLRVKPVAEYIGDKTVGNALTVASTQPVWVTNDTVLWYYGQTAPVSISPGQTVLVTFAVTMAADTDGTVNFSLETEAIQASLNAVQKLWTANPW